MRGRNWTDEEVARLRELAARGFTARQIGIELGRPRSGVIGKTQRLKIPLLLKPGYFRDDAKKERVRSTACRGAPAAGRLNAITNAQKRLAATPPSVGGIGFLAAADAGLCLFYAGDPMTRGGPDMPVCGAGRSGGGRYCAEHTRLQYQVRT